VSFRHVRDSDAICHPVSHPVSQLVSMSWKLGEKASGVLLMVVGSASVVATGMLAWEQKHGTDISKDFRTELDNFR